MRIAMTIIMLGSVAAMASAELTDLLADPGFEELGEDGQFTGWQIPPDTPGAVSVATDETKVFVGALAAQLVTGEADGRHFAQIRSTRVRPVLGAHYRAAVWAKGSGSARVAVTEQFRKRRATDPGWADTWSEPVQLSDEWVELVADATISNLNIARLFVTVEIEGEGATAWVDDCGLAIAGTVTITPPYAMVREGDDFSFSVAVEAEGKPLTEGALSVKTTNGDATADEELEIAGASSELVFTAPDAPEERLFRVRGAGGQEHCGGQVGRCAREHGGQLARGPGGAAKLRGVRTRASPYAVASAVWRVWGYDPARPLSCRCRSKDAIPVDSDTRKLPSRRKPNRLPPEEYQRQWQPVFFTACTRDRRPWLTDADFVAALTDLLDDNARANGCAVIAYCFLPDHIHVLACVAHPEGDVRSFFEGFKLGAANFASGRGIPSLWQRTYWDRHVRNMNHLWERINYILENAVDAGLCADAEDWPYSEFRGLPWEADPGNDNGRAGT